MRSSAELYRPLRSRSRRRGHAEGDSDDSGDEDVITSTPGRWPSGRGQNPVGVETTPVRTPPVRLHRKDRLSRSSSAAPTKLMERQELHKGDDKAWGTRHILLGCLLLALALCAWSFTGRAGGQAGDPRVNVPVSSLRPEDIKITADPFPITEFVTIADTYTNASLDFIFPHRTTNITLRLDAPGLARVNVASWLPKAWLDIWVWVTPIYGESRQVRALKAEHAPFVVDAANITLTLELMERLWPVLIHAATDLLALGLGRYHLDYRTLRNGLAMPQKREILSLVRARELWEGFHNRAWTWPYHGQGWLCGLRMGIWIETGKLASLRAAIRHEAGQRANNMSENTESGCGDVGPLMIGSSRPPGSQQLLRHAAQQHAAQPNAPSQTLPELLASLQVSSNSSAQIRRMLFLLARRDALHVDDGLGIKDNRWGSFRKLLNRTAAGQCHDMEGPISPLYIPYWADKGSSCTSHDCIGGLSDALCVAEKFLSTLGAAAEKVKARVAEERGDISLLERLASYYYKDGIAARTQALDRALNAFHPLLSGLKLQRRILAGMSTRVLHLRAIQDRLRDRVRSTYGNQSAWWNLAWDADREAVALTFVTLPELEDTLAFLDATEERMAAEQKALWDLHDAIDDAARQLKAKVSAGWLERLGLDGLPREEQEEGW